MKSFKSRQDWKTPKIDIAPIRIRYRVTEALVHMVKRSFNTMKGVGRPHDLDNNHMLSLIEQDVY